ncbi:MAG: hypothetical protein ABS75_07955 [Pelagibacterium sp. SCN 63-23]|nr:MAG: hypothetical protein ABS75_07955 [Pelagibacterium sp. SCN 63-23]
MTWDAFKNQDRLLREIDGKSRYRKEHLYRIKVGQANGSKTMAGMLAGEIAFLEELLGIGGYSTTPEQFLAELDSIATNPLPHLDADGRRGWEIAVRSERGVMKRYTEAK